MRSVRALAHDADNVYNARYSWVWRNDGVPLCLLLLVLCSLRRISPFIKRRTIKRLIKRGNYTQTFASFRANCPFVKRVRVPSVRTLIFILSFIFFSHYFLFRFARFFRRPSLTSHKRSRATNTQHRCGCIVVSNFISANFSPLAARCLRRGDASQSVNVVPGDSSGSSTSGFAGKQTIATCNSTLKVHCIFHCIFHKKKKKKCNRK